MADTDATLPRDAISVAGTGAPPRRRRRANLSAIAVIAHRDLIKLLRDRVRLVSELAFPLILVLVLGPALQAGFGSPGGFNLTFFVFTGVLAQTIWQSAVLGLVSLLADREEDFSQEIFVSPVSRYSIIAGKVIGEALVAMPTGARDHHHRHHRGCAADADRAARARPGAVHRGRLWRRVRAPDPREPDHPASGEPDLPVRPAAAVLPRRHLQSRSTTCRRCWRSCPRCRRCATRSS